MRDPSVGDQSIAHCPTCMRGDGQEPVRSFHRRRLDVLETADRRGLAAQLLIHEAKHGACRKRLLELGRQRGIAFGRTVIAGMTTIRAPPDSGAGQKRECDSKTKMCARRLVGLATATAPRPA